MSAELEIRRKPPLGFGQPFPTEGELDTIGRVVKAVSNTEFVPAALRGRPGAILGAILYGQALGLHPMVALAEVSVIEGRPSLSATAVLGRIRAAGHQVELAEDEGQCLARGRRTDTGDEHTAVWTMADAERAGLLGKPNWQRYPRAMLRSRAVTELARALFSDAFAGLSVYSPEEVGEANEGGAALATAPPSAAPEVVHLDATSLAEAEAEADELGRARRHLFAYLRELDENPDLGFPPEPSTTWNEFSQRMARQLYGVGSRGDLTAEQFDELREKLALVVAEQSGSDIPFG